MESITQYEAFEKVIKTAIPDTLVFQANMPLIKMDELARSTVKIVTYLFYQDTERVTSSGASGVHDVIIEINLFGPLEEIDRMAKSLNTLLLNDNVSIDTWTFVLSVKDKKDVWEPNIKSKRLWIQYKGIMIEENSE